MEEFDYDETFMGVSKKRDNYDKSFLEDYRLKRLTEFLKIKKGRVLDIGCGGGITTEALAKYFPQATLFGCDVSASALKYATKFGSGKVTYKQIVKGKLPFKSNYFDACISLDVIEHVPDIEFFMSEVHRVLKKDGQFFSHTPTEGQVLTHTWLWKTINIGKKMTYRRYGHIHPELTQKLLLKKIKSNGFKIAKISYSEHLLFQLSSVLFYFLPLELLELVLKKNADIYKDKNIIRAKKKASRPMLGLRNCWLSLSKATRLVTYLETESMKKIATGALKINILAIKK